MFMLKVIFTLLISCTGNVNSSSVHSSQKGNLQQGKELEVFIRKWQSDSLGCEKLRTKEVSETIIDSFKLQSKTQAEFLKVLGKPNAENEIEGNKILIYYFDNICRERKFIHSADYCIAEFTFKANKLISRNYICQ